MVSSAGELSVSQEVEVGGGGSVEGKSAQAGVDGSSEVDAVLVGTSPCCARCTEGSVVVTFPAPGLLPRRPRPRRLSLQPQRRARVAQQVVRKSGHWFGPRG